MNNTKNLFKKFLILGILSLGLILIVSKVYANGGSGSPATAWINADSNSLRTTDPIVFKMMPVQVVLVNHFKSKLLHSVT